MEIGGRYQRVVSVGIFMLGVSCMIGAGYLLIQGLSEFSGNENTRNILIVFGILFQITESVCFILAASITSQSRTWRLGMLGLGATLFIFSIGVMTLAQKAALQRGINQATAIDEKRDYVRAQITSLDRMIESYQYNAGKQSKSIYKDSRALGQDSINRATELEREKMSLSDELFTLNQDRRETSKDFFGRLESVTGLPAESTEFYFLAIRSLLVELCGIMMLSFGAALLRPSVPPVKLYSRQALTNDRIAEQDHVEELTDEREEEEDEYYDDYVVLGETSGHEPVRSEPAQPRSDSRVSKFRRAAGDTLASWRNRAQQVTNPTSHAEPIHVSGEIILGRDDYQNQDLESEEPDADIHPADYFENLDSETQQLVYDVLVMYKNKELLNVTRDSIRNALNISNMKSKVVAKAARMFIESAQMQTESSS